jgi:hypothetical protein
LVHNSPLLQPVDCDFFFQRFEFSVAGDELGLPALSKDGARASPGNGRLAFTRAQGFSATTLPLRQM